MLEFFKTFLQGLLYVIISPVLLAIFSLYLLYAIITYFILEISSFFYFFSGRNINSEDDETRQLLQIQNDILAAKGLPTSPVAETDKPDKIEEVSDKEDKDHED